MAPHDHSVFFTSSLFARYKLKDTTEQREASKMSQKANLDGQPASDGGSLVFTRRPDWLVSGVEKGPVRSVPGPVGVAWCALEGPLILGDDTCHFPSGWKEPKGLW